MCILNEVKSTEHTLVVLEVLEVEGGDRGASVFHAGPTHFCCEEPTRTGIDALPFGEFGVGDWVRGAHRHASPGRVISVRTQRTVLLAGERLIVSPTIGRALVDAEVSCGVSKGVLKSAVNIQSPEASLEAHSGLVVAVSTVGAAIDTCVCGVVPVQAREEWTSVDTPLGGVVGIGIDSHVTYVEVWTCGTACSCEVVSVVVVVDLAVFCTILCDRVGKIGRRTVLHTETGSIESEVA